jgi:diacylglycerol diphosphate phosphatase/phosphatidate phosphatase
VSRGPVDQPTTMGKVTLGALLKHHLRDWLWIGVMIVLEIIVYVVIPPFHRYIDAYTMQNYMYPSKGETVPTWSILV